MINKPNNQQKPKFEIDYNNFSNMADINKFINKQLWVTGSSFQTNNGNQVNETVKWGGQSRFLIGFNFLTNDPSQHTISINLNQELVIENTNLAFLTPMFNIRFIQYYEFIRPLSGSDTLTFHVNSLVSDRIYYSVYMTRSYNRYYARD